jgi:hypothetical protein
MRKKRIKEGGGRKKKRVAFGSTLAFEQSRSIEYFTRI